MMARARQLPGARQPSTPCSASSPRARTPSPRAGTRSGAAGRCGCRPRRRPSRPPAQGGGHGVLAGPGPAAWPRRRDPPDAIVMTSFGDATVNHATALAAFNTARYGARIGLPMPVLFVCETTRQGSASPPGLDRGHVREPAAPPLPTGWWRAGRDLGHRGRCVPPRAGRSRPMFLHLVVPVGPSVRRRAGVPSPTRSRPSNGRIRSSVTGAAWRSGPPHPTSSAPRRRCPRARVGCRRGATHRPRLSTTAKSPLGPLSPRPGRGSDCGANARRRSTGDRLRHAPRDGDNPPPAPWPGTSTRPSPTSWPGDRSSSSSGRTLRARAACTT